MKRGVDFCPNCGTVWGIDEMQFGECSRCNYPSQSYEFEDDSEFIVSGIYKEKTPEYIPDLNTEFPNFNCRSRHSEKISQDFNNL